MRDKNPIDKKTRNEWYRDWWKKNKERVNKKRRERYNNDQQYHEHVVKQAKKRYDRSKKENLENFKKKSRDKYLKRKFKKEGFIKIAPRQYKVKGKGIVQLFSAKDFSLEVGLNYKTARNIIKDYSLVGVDYIPNSIHVKLYELDELIWGLKQYVKDNENTFNVPTKRAVKKIKDYLENKYKK